jgi:phosphatidylglycerophosphatase A
MSEIDPIAYGVLTQKVENLEKKIDKMEASIDELIGLVNQGKGGVWVGMAIMSGLSSLIGFFAHYFFNKS